MPEMPGTKAKKPISCAVIPAYSIREPSDEGSALAFPLCQSALGIVSGCCNTSTTVGLTGIERNRQDRGTVQDELQHLVGESALASLATKPPYMEHCALPRGENAAREQKQF